MWIAGVGGLFGFHAFYFAALGLAPPAPAMLVCNTWPLVIVVGLDLMERGRPAATTLLAGRAEAGLPLAAACAMVAAGAAIARLRPSRASR